MASQLMARGHCAARTTDAYGRVYSIARALSSKGWMNAEMAARACGEPLSRMEMYLRAAYAMGYAERRCNADEGFDYRVTNTAQALAEEQRQRALAELARVRDEVTT
jgi:hypothetical protein